MSDAQRDTIFALSSGRPPAAIAVIRIAGPRARAAVEALGVKVPEPRRVGLARFRDPASGEIIDEGLVLWFEAAKSEIGEDTAELQPHGGRAIIAALLAALGRVEGLRPAEAGEFTRRAFENGRLDLTAVEGLADLVMAETEGQRRQAYRQMRGALGKRADAWRERLIEALALVEAGIDFSDEGDVPQDLLAPALAIARELAAEIEGALADGHRGERLREGLTVAIAGPPNAGKSTLLNRIARREVAIVSPYAGTTRDVIEVHLDLGGLPVTLLDTAGIRATEDPVELEGVRRAQARAAEADLVLWVVDATEPLPAGAPGGGDGGSGGADRTGAGSNESGAARSGAEAARTEAGAGRHEPEPAGHRDGAAAVRNEVGAWRSRAAAGTHESAAAGTEARVGRGLAAAAASLSDAVAAGIADEGERSGADLGRNGSGPAAAGARAGRDLAAAAGALSDAVAAGIAGEAERSGADLGRNGRQAGRDQAGTDGSGLEPAKNEAAAAIWLVRNKVDLIQELSDGLEKRGPDYKSESNGRFNIVLKYSITNVLNHPSERGFIVDESLFNVSASSGAGVPVLLDALARRAADVLAGAESALVTRARHRHALEDALAALRRAVARPLSDREDLLAEELRLAARALARLTGRVDVEDILDVIFRDFCIGK